MNEQTNNQRGFTVIPLPVFPIVTESLLLPLNCLPELVKFGGIPFLVMLAFDAICYGLQRQDVSNDATNMLLATAHVILFTPFCVAWTKLAITGPRSVANHPTFAYSRTQWMYLLASIVVFVAVMVCVGIPYVVYRYGQRNFDNQITVLGGVGLFIGLGLFLIGYLRLAFVFPAIAVSRYAGISVAWRQTAGNIERLAAIVLLSSLPYWLIRLAFERYIGYHPPGVIEAARGIVDVLLVSLASTALAGPALAYKTLVLDQGQPMDAIAANDSDRKSRQLPVDPR